VIEPALFFWGQGHSHHFELWAAIDRIKERHPTAQLGAGSGWSSPKTLHEHGELAPLLEWTLSLEPIASRGPFRWDAWANIMHRNDHILTHGHHFARLAALYYVEADAEGPLILVNDDEEIEIDIEPGMLVIMDGMQQHRVEQYQGARRVSIAMNFYAGH
jgi:hypothetical protein